MVKKAVRKTKNGATTTARKASGKATKKATKSATKATKRRTTATKKATKSTKAAPKKTGSSAKAKKDIVRQTRYPEHPGVYVQRSSIHGTGLFADQDFAKGDRMVEYLGEKITKKESDRRYEKQEKRGRVYIFDLNQKWDLDGDIKRNPAKYANHGCQPNAESDIIRGHIYIIARKRIKKGEEIVYDYNFPYDDWWERPCLCGGKKCRGYIIGADAARKLTQRIKRYGKAGTRKLDEAEQEEED